MKQHIETPREPVPRRLIAATALAALSTIGSISVALVGGLQRGSVVVDQALLAGVNVIAVLAAQFLPALTPSLPANKRIACLLLWSACVAYSVLGHAWYLLSAQERSGVARAHAVSSSATSPPAGMRELAVVLNDKVKISEQIARLPVLACEDACAERQRLRKLALTERIAALDAEAQEIADRREARQQLEARERQAAEDLVGGRLAAVLGVTYSSATWIMALSYAIILEGVGCLCWAAVFKPETPRSRHEVTGWIPETDSSEVMPPAGIQRDPTSHGIVELGTYADDPSHEDEGVTRVKAAVHDGTLKPTVVEIRSFLRCSQERARQVRRAIVTAA